MEIKGHSIYQDGEEILTLNDSLIQKQGLTNEQVELILKLHMRRIKIETEMESAPREQLKGIYVRWEHNQAMLQKAWGFPSNERYWAWWRLKPCTCPKLDNWDRYPHGPYIYSQNCPLHGWEEK